MPWAEKILRLHITVENRILFMQLFIRAVRVVGYCHIYAIASACIIIGRIEQIVSPILLQNGCAFIPHTVSAQLVFVIKYRCCQQFWRSLDPYEIIAQLDCIQLARLDPIDYIFRAISGIIEIRLPVIVYKHMSVDHRIAQVKHGLVLGLNKGALRLLCHSDADAETFVAVTPGGEMHHIFSITAANDLRCPEITASPAVFQIERQATVCPLLQIIRNLMAYSVKPNEAYLSKQGIENIKSSLAKEIFQQDLLQIYQKQTDIRDELRQEGWDRIQQIVEEINQGQYQNPEMETLLLQLSKRLEQHKGKKQYGYLNTGSKKIVDAIVAELAADSRIQELYKLWYEQKEDVLRTYTNTFPDRVPLEQNKEFKTIRNAVVQAALEIAPQQLLPEETAQDQAVESPLSAPCAPVVEVSPPPSDVSTSAPQTEAVSPPLPDSLPGNAVARLIQYLAKLLQEDAEQNFQKRQSIDRKLRRQIEEKKQAQGLKSDGYSGMQM